ncbi:MAG: NAD(P)/FAD-dependent oxidoreductase [Halobacteriaceae archaeon]
MPPSVVVLGAGYAGAGAVPVLEDALDGAELTWVSATDYHLVLHEVHRVVRDPAVEERITVPVDAIKSPSTAFVEGEVVGVDTGERAVELADGRAVDYDYLLVALGSATADYGIPGMDEHAHTLKSLDDALGIHDAVADAARDATPDDPARAVVGGAGLSGIQTAGEIAAYRDDHGAPIEVCLVEALEEIFPPGTPALQRRLRRHLEAAGVEILVDDPITEVEAGRIHFDERDPLANDVFVWTGGITGREALAGAGVDDQHNRLETDATFRTSDERVFAVGDAAVVDLDGGTAPPTAQAAWDAAEVAAENVARAVRGEPPRRWEYKDLGTLISVGETAIAHDITLPVVGTLPVETFDGAPAKLLKKASAARWIASVSSLGRAASAWPVL